MFSGMFWECLQKYYKSKKIWESFIKISMEPDKISSFDITLIDLENPNLSFSLCLTTNESIQKVRSYIEEEDEWKGINFKFMNGSSPLLKSSEKEKIISDIISNNKLYIRSGKKQGKKSEQDIVKEKYIQSLKTKEEVEKLLVELDNFEKKYKTQGKYRMDEKKNDLKDVGTKLKNIGINITFKEQDVSFKSLKDKLSQISKDSDALLQELKTVKFISTEDMIKNFPTQICCGLYNGERVHQNILDFDKTRIECNNSKVGLDEVVFQYSSSSQYQSQSKKYQQRITGGKLNIMGATPFCFVKAGIDVNSASQSQKAQKQKELSNYWKNEGYYVYGGEGVKITEDNFKIREDVIEQYTKLLKTYSQDKEDKNFKNKVLQFLKKYGMLINIGDYLFGGIFRIQNELTFKSKKTFSERKNAGSFDFNVAVAGGGIFTGGFVAGNGAVNHQNNSGSESLSGNKNTEYKSIKKISSYPPVNSVPEWKEIIVFKKNYWKLLGSHEITRPIYALMKNKVNKNKVIEECEKNLTLDTFQNLLGEIYEDSLSQNGEKLMKKNQDEIHIVLIGMAKSGKSYFGNQLVGNSIEQPFRSHSSVNSVTKQIEKCSIGRFFYYDTPGLKNNTGKFSQGQLERNICELVNAGNKITKETYKSINAFLIVVKMVDRLNISQTIFDIMNMFGKKVLKSSIIIFNCPSEQKISSLQSEIYQNHDFKSIKQFCETFDFKNQVFFNYKFNENKPFKEQFENYGAKKMQLLVKMKTLPIYDSQTYKKYREQELKKQKDKDEKERKKIEEQVAKQMKEKEEFLIKKEVQNYFKSMRYFRIQNHKTKRYIKHGMLVGGWYKFGIGERGFTVGNVSNLFLGSISVDPQKGRIRGSLGDEDFPSRRACTNEGGYIGYRDVTGPHSIQEVTIRFIGGLKEMLNFKNDLKANIKISLQGDGLVDNDDRLMRENGEGDNWYLLHA